MSSFTKGILCITSMIAIVGMSSAQIPNPGFENWANGDPVGWGTGNGIYTFVTNSSSAHGGTSAAQGSIVNMGMFNLSCTLSADGFPVSQRYGSLHGFYTFTSVGGDAFFFSYLAQKGSSGVGAGSYIDASPQLVFREFIANILYPGPDVPDNGVITIQISGGGGLPHIGSIFVVDDLSFGASTGVNDLPNGQPKAFRLEQNYPNPFNPTTNIVYDVPEQSRVTMKVFDVIGREIAVLIDQQQDAGRYKAVFNASALPSGVYYYRLAAGNFVETRKMTVVK